MAESDWSYLSNGLSVSSVARGVTAGITPPNGGSSFVFGFNSLLTTAGAVGLYANLANFAPMAKGGSVRGCIQRGISNGTANFSPFLFIGLNGSDVSSTGYLLGLQDGATPRIALRKGSFAVGLPEGAVGPSLGILRRSIESVNHGDWLQLRLDMIVNTSGDVVLKAFKSDLSAHACTSPSWVAIPGMDDFIDDALGVNSGSAPLTSGRAGFGFNSKDVQRRAYFDQLEILRQL